MRLLCFVLLLALVVPAGRNVAEARPRPSSTEVARVRPHDGRAAGLILEALSRSALVRRLVDHLEKSDVIVYVETQPALRGRVAGSLTWLTRTAHFRYVRISIAPDQFGEMGIALLGHELQHAVEVADNPSVIDVASLEALYRRIGISVGSHLHGWDTDAAREMGEDIRRELVTTRAQRARIVESTQDFDPLDWHVMYNRVRDGVR